MRFILLLIPIIASCSRAPVKETPGVFAMAFDSAAEEKIRATAIKRVEKKGVCFEISLWVKDGKKEQVLPSGWKVAWLDRKRHVHPLTVRGRTPSSTPMRLIQEELSNHFVACAPEAKFREVRALVLEPSSEVVAGQAEELRLYWQR